MIFLLVAAALLAGAPFFAAVLVSVASIREDAAKSLAGHPPGVLTRAARRLLRASVGDSGPLPRPARVTAPPRGGKPRWQLPRWQLPRPIRTRPIPAPRWPADDEPTARSDDVLAAPRS